MDPEHIRQWLEDIGQTQADLARALGITPDKVSKAMARIRRFTADEVLRIKAMMEAGGLGFESQEVLSQSDLIYVRQVDISYSMGDGAIVDDFPDTGIIPFNLSLIRSVTRSNIEHLFIATGQGDSMEPTLLRSDLLMIDSSQNRVAFNDQIWALSYAGCGMVKRLRRQRGEYGDELVIMSDNAVIADQVVPLEDVHIIGRLVWVGRRM